MRSIAVRHTIHRWAYPVLGIAVLAGLILVLRIFTGCLGLSCLVSEELSGYRVVSVGRKDSGVYQATYRKGSEVLTIRSVRVKDTGAVDDYIRQYLADILGMYDTLRSPYPGQLSQAVVCDQSLRPEVIRYPDAPDSTVVIRGVMSANGAFGVCNAGEVGYRAEVTLLYCRDQGRLHTIERMKPVIENSSVTTDPVIRCR